MTFISKLQDARKLNLPGRLSRELIGSKDPSEKVSLRYVVINPSKPITNKRKPHFHPNCEECIYVLSGHGLTHSGGHTYKIEAGDTILISKGEHHYTENIGTNDLKLICFFPEKNVELIESENST
jgi:mannose-6-phosphate isomerase-like protein (cupin superfamily)